MKTTSDYNSLFEHFVHVRELKALKLGDKKDLKKITSVMTTSLGVKEYIFDDFGIEAGTIFMIRLGINHLDEVPSFYHKPFVNTSNILVVSNHIERLPAIAIDFLQSQTLYFKTHTDEWGRTYGE